MENPERKRKSGKSEKKNIQREVGREFEKWVREQAELKEKELEKGEPEEK